MKFIKNMEWRYATKQFDPNKKVSAKSLNTIKKAIQLSASSYGLQPYKVLIIKDETVRRQLRAVSWNQSQVTEASHLFVFCNYTKVKPDYIDSYIDLVASVRNNKLDELKSYGDFIKMKIAEKTNEQQFYWAKHQAYIGLANLLSVCSDLNIDTCPMEGFEREQYNNILGLTEKGLNAAVIAAVGYRSNEDNNQHKAKVRKSMEVLFDTI